MKILLLGEYSNVHWTLAEGLRTLGHEVLVVSDGDGFKNYQRDVDISMPTENRWGQIVCIFRILKALPKLKGFDVVQIINPNFTRIHRLNLRIYKYLKKHNKKIFLGAFGDDYFYTKACAENKIYRYSEFFVDGKPTNIPANKELKNAWIGTFRQQANEEIADNCNGIIAGLVEYYMAYEEKYKDKLTFIPFPSNLDKIAFQLLSVPEKVTFFIGINKQRFEIKGTDLFLQALKQIKEKYPNEVEVIIAESLSYNQYVKRLRTADVVLDQTYSYSYGMNGQLALAQGKVLMSGAEPEVYTSLNEYENRPIINVLPTVRNIYSEMEKLIINKASIPQLSEQGRAFVEKHHKHLTVAEQYINFWNLTIR